MVNMALSREQWQKVLSALDHGIDSAADDGDEAWAMDLQEIADAITDEIGGLLA